MKASNERGAILTLFAFMLSLIALFTIGYAIDLPTVHSATIRAQHALDVGSAHGVHAFHSYENAARAAFVNAGGVMDGSYGAAGYGNFSNGFSGNDTVRIWIPRFNDGSTAFPGPLYSFAGLPTEARHRAALDLAFDVPPIDDFRNAVAIFARFVPNQYYPVVPQTGIEVVSVAMLRTVLSYVIIDPAFSMDEANFHAVFGPSETSTANMWPVAAVVAANDGEVPTGSWQFPSTVGLLSTDPVGGPPFSPGGLPTGSATDSTLSARVYRYYAAACDSLPFVNYKATATNLLDWFTGSSAFNSTTMVGLTGYSISTPLVPIHPLISTNGISRHPTGPSGFPLPQNPNVSNRGLHEKRGSVFDGYVNTLNPSVTANRTAGPDGSMFTSDDQLIATGLNRWELCYCRGLYIRGAGNVPYVLADDANYVPGDELALHHASIEKRRRNNLAVNWCDDERVSATGVHQPRDTIVNLKYSQDGANRSTDGETARNIVAGQGMRLVDLQIDSVMSPPSGRWARPPAPLRVDQAVSAPVRATESGFRHIPAAIGEAMTRLVEARDDYGRDPAYGTRRPIGRTAVIVFAFGLWSRSTAADLAAASGLTISQFRDNALRGLRQTMAEALCDNGVSVIFNFLPMNDYDLETVIAARDVISEYELIYDAHRRGESANPTQIPNIYRPARSV